MAKKAYTWFVSPEGDSHTNGVIANFLQEIHGSEESALIDVPCADGRKRNLWQVTHEQAKSLWDSQSDQNLKIKIFGKEGDGKIKDKTFLFRKPHLKRKRRTPVHAS